MKIAVVFGTRPEAIKLAPVVLALRESGEAEVDLISTGQHRELLNKVLSTFDIHADRQHDIMLQGQSLASLNSKALMCLEQDFVESRPDLVVVHGDTTTAMSAAFAAFYNGIPVAHVEAGLRTNDLKAPFPEELNRQIIGRIADLNFAPTPLSRDNLIREGIEDQKIYVTGNTVVDAASFVHQKYFDNAEQLESIRSTVAIQLPGFDTERPFALLTLHRRENSGSRFVDILNAIKQVARKNPGFSFVFPVHPNPAIRSLSQDILAREPNIFLGSHFGYLEFSLLLSRCTYVLTDSGGVQEEAVSFGRRVLVARDTTERPEGLKSGLMTLVGSDAGSIASLSQLIIDDNESAPPAINLTANPFGDGNAAQRIAERILKSS